MIEKLLKKLGYVDEDLLIESEKNYDAMIDQNIALGESAEAYKLSNNKLRKKLLALQKHVKSKRK